MYAKINENGYPVFFTDHFIKSKGRLIINPSAEELSKLGYKPLNRMNPPALRENEIISVSYIDVGDHIDEIYSVLEA